MIKLRADRQFQCEKYQFNSERTPDHEMLNNFLEWLTDRYEGVNVGSLGKSIFGRSIPIISLGEGNTALVYVGAHHGAEGICSGVLMKFLAEYCNAVASGGKMFGISCTYLDMMRKIYIIPMLNPDGVEYSAHGVSNDNILYDRLIAMNGGSTDFKRWQANARGVDLNHNYDAGFLEYKQIEAELGIVNGAPTKYSGEAPFSEPETNALGNFLRFESGIKLVLSFHSQGEEIYYRSEYQKRGAHRKADQIGKVLSRISGYKLSSASGTAAYGGLADWCASELAIPAFTFECGRGENPLPPSSLDKIYASLRETLFTAPTLV